MDGFSFQVDVIRTDRKKSASLQIEGDRVRAIVPKSLSDKRIRDLITKRTPWIRTKFKEQSERPASKPKEYVSGETFPYLGKNYRLKIVRAESPSVKLKNGYLVATISKKDMNPQKTAKSLLEDWYRSHAEVRLRDKTERFSNIIGIAPSSVSVRSFKSRWGSCSNKGDITFNWKIILTPHQIVDYVVVHELCHMLEHNHSPKYWKHVERYVPDWKVCRDWLKSNPIIL